MNKTGGGTFGSDTGRKGGWVSDGKFWQNPKVPGYFWTHFLAFFTVFTVKQCFPDFRKLTIKSRKLRQIMKNDT